MTTKAPKPAKEKIYECQVKRRRLKSDGTRGYESFWKEKSVREALVDGDQEFRCKDCHGHVKLHKSHVASGPGPHAEHKSRQDSEFCPSGMYFQEATDGREPRLSESPVS